MKLMKYILLVIAFSCSMGYVYSQSDGGENKGSGRPYRSRSLLNPAARKNSVKEALLRLSNVPIPHPGVAKIVYSADGAASLPAPEGILRSSLELVTADEESALKNESPARSELTAEVVRSSGLDDGKEADEESLRTFHFPHHHKDRAVDDSGFTNPTIPVPNQEQPPEATKPICFMPINLGTGPNNVIPGGGGPNNIIWVPNNNNNPQNNPAGGFIIPNNPLNPNYGNNNNPTYPQFPLNSLNFGNVGSLGLGPNLCITPCQNTQNGDISSKNNPDNTNPNEANEPDSISQIISGGTHGAEVITQFEKNVNNPGKTNIGEVPLNNMDGKNPFVDVSKTDQQSDQFRSAVVAESPVPSKREPRFLPVNYRYPAYPGYYYPPQISRQFAVNPYSPYYQQSPYFQHPNMW